MDHSKTSSPLSNAEFMLSGDLFSQWLGIELMEIQEKYCKIKMGIRPEMINGLKTVHGGIIFSFADSALAFSSNNTAQASVALNCVINFTTAVREGEEIFAESKLISDTRKTGVYDILITNQEKKVVASFRGTVYKLGRSIYDL